MLGGGGPPAERRGVLGAPFAYRPIRRTDRSARPEMILKPLGWSAKVVLTGIDVLVMKGDWVGALLHIHRSDRFLIRLIRQHYTCDSTSCRRAGAAISLIRGNRP